MTLTLTFDLHQGQICCRAGDHNSSNLLVSVISQLCVAATSMALRRYCCDIAQDKSISHDITFSSIHVKRPTCTNVYCLQTLICLIIYKIVLLFTNDNRKVFDVINLLIYS